MSAYTFSNSVRENLSSFWNTVDALGLDRRRLLKNAERNLDHTPAYRLNQLLRCAAEAKVRLEEIACFDRYSGALFPEDCTVFFAAGKASRSGYTVFGKNSDKSGSDAFNSDLYYRNRQINVVLYSINPDGSHVVGVSAAGATGLKMGMNSHGVAVGTNYGETDLAARRALDLDQQMAGDRAQLARDALTERTALQAAQKVVAILMERPMASSGVLEFADAKDVYIVENAYEYTAIKRVTDAVDARANFFNLMSQLNTEGNVSSFCRYHRAKELLEKESGNVTVETLRKIAADHGNGPGGNSICRHSTGMSSATLSSAIMEIDGEHPEKSKIHIALGTPCRAWSEADGHVTIPMDVPECGIPEAFRSGEAFRRFCLLPPLETAAES